MADGKLTDKQQRFVEAFDGNATQAAIVAGYSAKSAEKLGHDLLKIPKVAQAIKKREDRKVRPLIANREARQKFWTETMQNEEVKMPDRLKASELLGKSEGDFLERRENMLSGGLAIRWADPQEAPNDGDV